MMGWLSALLADSALVGFYALGLVAMIASFRVIVHTNPVHAILSMIVSLLAVAGIFFILGASFAGALEIIVYAGAILVLFVFVIMMLNLGKDNEAQEKQWLSSEVWAVPTGLMLVIAVVLYAMISAGDASSSMVVMATQDVPAKAVGIALFSEYLLVVEVASFLLLSALVAAYHLGKRALDDENISHSSQRQGGDGGYRLVNAEDFKHLQSNEAKKAVVDTGVSQEVALQDVKEKGQ